MAKRPNILEYNLDTIKKMISRKIGDFNNSGAGYVPQLYEDTAQDNAWFKKDVNRRKYGNYQEYAEKMYFDNQVWTPFVNGVNYVNDLGNYLYPQTNYPDTHLGDVSHEALIDNIANSLYNYYTTRTEYGNDTINAAINRKKSISNWVSKSFSIYGYLNEGVRVAVDPMTGFIGEIESYKLGDEQNSDITGIYQYGAQTGIDPWTENVFASKDKCAQPTQKAYEIGKIETSVEVLQELSQSVVDTVYNVLSYNKYNLLGAAPDNTYGKYSKTFVTDENNALAHFNQDDKGIHSAVDYHIAENGTPQYDSGNDNSTDDTFEPIDNIDSSTATPTSLLDKTRSLFNNHKTNTLLARFCSGDMPDNTIDPALQTAISQYGISRGRNLLAKNPDKKTNGYDNPYCRVWTYHHQYDRYNRTIRPFDGDFAQGNKDWVGIRASGSTDGGTTTFNGGKYLDDNTVLNYENNLVRISPQISDGTNIQKNELKRCMFSIENLAWRDVAEKHGQLNVLSPDQRGPFGGRIMWFPPYDLKFSEQTQVDYSASSFIGRGEKIHSYVDTERTGQLSFKILADHPSIVNLWAKGQGGSMIGSSNTSDDPEGDLLRFFAGCGELEPFDDEKITIKVTKQTQDTPAKDEKYIRFFVFFPNNYTGIDDSKEIDPDFPIMYLLNGVGTQQVYDKETKTEITLPLNTIATGITSVSAVTDSSGNTLNYKYDNLHYINTTKLGGYEMAYGDEFCLSQIVQNNALNRNINDYTLDVEAKSDIDKKTLARGYELIQIDNTEYIVLGIVGGDDHYDKNEMGYTPGLWCYRIDKDYQKDKEYGETLVKKGEKNYTDYADVKSYGFNSAHGLNILKNEFPDDSATIISFAEIAKAIMDETKINSLQSEYFNNTTVENIKEIFAKNVITRIRTSGSASAQGHGNKNATLARNRSLVIKYWLTKNLKEKLSKTSFEVLSSNRQTFSKANMGNSQIETKLDRSTEVRVYYQEQSTYEQQIKDENSLLEGLGVVLNQETTVTNTQYNKIKQALENKGYNIEKITTTAAGNQISTGSYGNEYQYFKQFAPEDKFYMSVKEQIPYFSPAFHSISPEGFNARLTFLQQCTRQGPTQGADGNAYNLAFGRPPICILRIGDFYYTKILITSLSINMDNTTWDLNPEGIGVQPMLADVSLNFKFLGGSGLEGPIARLQNAISSNFYANTGVYDINAEQVTEYEEDTPNNKIIRPNNIILNVKK